MPSLFARQNPLDDARNTLSSWDNCMAKSYCKWPVIVAIIVGSLILISVITCVARCICCGAECACCCFRCCTCCCSGGGRSGHKRVKSEPTSSYPTYGAPPVNPYAQAHAAGPPPPIDTRPVNQQYRSNVMPSFGVAPTPQPARPQFATFDSTKAVVNDDALPAMPTWKEGRDVHVAVDEQPIPEKRGDVELDRLNHNGSITNNSMAGMAAVPGARRSPASGRSPVSPVSDSYGFPPGYQNSSSHRHSPGPYGGPQNDFRRGSPGANISLMPGGEYTSYHNQAYGHRSPGQVQPYGSYEDSPRYEQYNQGQNTHDQRDYYDEQVDRYQSPPPHPQNSQYQVNHSPYNDPYDGPAPAPGAGPQRSYTPLSGTTKYEPSVSPAPAYPGQQTYNAGGSAYPGQQSYQAFQPGTGIARKPVDGSYRES